MKNGFTLIELIVVVGIIVMLSGGSLAAFVTFNQRQSLDDDAATFATELAKAQNMSTAIYYPAGCSNITAYQVSFSKDDNRTQIAAICKEGTINYDPQPNVILKNSTFQNAGPVTFMAGSGVSTDQNIVLVSDKNGSTKTVHINSVGTIEVK